VDTLDDLQALINTVNTSTNVISTAAQDNSASEAKPAEGDYFAAGVKGVTAANLAAINSALNSNTVDGEATNTTAEIQTVVNSYQAILDAANGIDDKTTATNPSATDYKNIGVTGVDGATAAAKASLLGDAIDLKNKADVDTVREVQDLADAVAAVMTGAAGGTAPTLDQLQKLGVTGVNPANLEQIRKAITETPDEGTGVNTLDKIQALVDSGGPSPRRLSVGLERDRLAMLLAVLHRHAGVQCGDQDVFVNAVGGVRISEPAADLAVLLAIQGSLRGKALPSGFFAFGEVGLAGEVRPAPRGQERLKEAAKLGFSIALVPRANVPKKPIEGLTIHAVERIEQAIERHILVERADGDLIGLHLLGGVDNLQRIGGEFGSR
jgi:hypothetical protein